MNYNYLTSDILCEMNYVRQFVKKQECGVVNLNTSKQLGSHHTCYWVSGDKKYYFDSFGVIPPRELVK